MDTLFSKTQSQQSTVYIGARSELEHVHHIHPLKDMPIAQAVQKPLGRLKDYINGGEGSPPHLERELNELIESVELTSPNGMIKVTCSSFGATVTSIVLRGDQEITVNEENWIGNDVGQYKGRTCGRLAGRVSPYVVKAFDQEDSYAFDSQHPLHGGKVGFSHRVWKLVNTFVSQRSARAVFELASEHFDQGHPGSVAIECHISATEENSKCRFDVRYRARLDKRSPCQGLVNLTSHVYFNLGGGFGKFNEPSVSVFDHELWLPSCDQVQPEHFDTRMIPVTEQGSKFDYTKASRKIAEPLDHCFIRNGINNQPADQLKEIAAELSFGNLKMQIRSSTPALVVYTGNNMNNKGLCLECQYPPNCPQMPQYLKSITLEGKSSNLSKFGVGTRLSSPSNAPCEIPFEYDEVTTHEFSLLS